MAVNISKSYRVEKYPNNEIGQGVYCFDSRTVPYKVSPSGASADPFTSKTNKYAESKIIRLTATADIYFKLGDSSISAADANDHLLPLDTPIYILIDEDEPYLRVFGTADVHVAEIY